MKIVPHLIIAIPWLWIEGWAIKAWAQSPMSVSDTVTLAVFGGLACIIHSVVQVGYFESES